MELKQVDVWSCKDFHLVTHWLWRNLRKYWIILCFVHFGASIIYEYPFLFETSVFEMNAKSPQMASTEFAQQLKRYLQYQWCVIWITNLAMWFASKGVKWLWKKPTSEVKAEWGFVLMQSGKRLTKSKLNKSVELRRKCVTRSSKVMNKNLALRIVATCVNCIVHFIIKNYCRFGFQGSEGFLLISISQKVRKWKKLWHSVSDRNIQTCPFTLNMTIKATCCKLNSRNLRAP